jgi:sec-independent protein translocase protein TatB
VFDIGFFELLVVGVVGLLVIGPERLPETVRTVALWWGRLKRSIQSTRTEIEQQIGADDIRRQLHNEEVMRRLEESQESIKRTVSENVEEINKALDVGDDISAPLNELKDTLEASTHSAPANSHSTKSADKT